MGHNANRSHRLFRRAQLLLTLNMLVLGWIVIQNIPASPAHAEAAPQLDQRRPMGIGNPAEQRETIIAQLRQLQGKVDGLAAKLSKPIEVKVIQMPTVKD
jgi:hypothetical protein